MADTLKVLGLAGSLRQGSFNRAALNAAIELAPTDLVIEAWDGLREIPPYDQDVKDKGWPGPVADLRDRIAAADGVLIAMPEYNYSVPGVLKNAIDWTSRPPRQPFKGKPVAIMGASPGGFGTARGQAHLRLVLMPLDARVLSVPEVLIANAGDKFEDGKLTDDKTRAFFRDTFLPAFADWIRKQRG